MEEPANWTIQKIEIRDTVPIEKAHQIYKKITGKKPRKISESKNFFHFRVVPPTKFEKKSFRTKVINDDIRIVFGIIKEEHKHLVGGSMWDYFKKGYDYVANKVSGAIDYVKDALTISDFSDSTKALLNKYGHFPIASIQLRRVPVSDTLQLVLQGVSAGEWERLKQREGFDKFFHLSMVVTLRGAKSRKQLAIEKLAVVSVNERIETAEGMETQEVPIPSDHSMITIKGMFDKTRQRVGDSKFFSYSALGHNNCQDFMEMLLSSEGLYREPERLFVFQDVSALARDLPEFTKQFSQGTTYLGALANKYFGIGGSRVTLDHLMGSGVGEQIAYFDSRWRNNPEHGEDWNQHHRERILATFLARVQALIAKGRSENDVLEESFNDEMRLLYPKKGGNQASGFIRAMMGRESTNPEVQEDWANDVVRPRGQVKRYKQGARRGQIIERRAQSQSNADKFRGLNREGFKIQEMSKTTHDLARKKKALTRNQAIKRFYDYVIANAPQHQPTHVGDTNYLKTYDLDRMYDQWVDLEGLVVRGDRQRRRAQEIEEVIPAPIPALPAPIPAPVAPVAPNPLRELAMQYDTVAKANGLGKDRARAVFRQLGGNPRVPGNNRLYRPAREVAQLIAEYANRILQQ